MRVGLLLFLAKQNLVESKLILALLVAAVAAGLTFHIPNTANLAGYDAELIEEGLSAGYGDVRLRPKRGRFIDDADELCARVAKEEDVIAVAPILTMPGALGRGGHFSGVIVTGFDANVARRPFRLVEGTMPERGDAKGIVIGGALAERLKIKIGDEVDLRIILGPANTALEGNNVGSYTMIIRGLAGGGFGVCGAEAVLVDRTFLAGELGETSVADMILVYGDHFRATELESRINVIAPNVETRVWNEDSPFIDSAIRSSAAIGTLSATMIVLAIVIPVWALLHVHMLHRRRQVGLLRAIGFGRGDVFLIFMFEAFLIGLLGVMLGTIFGYALTRYFQANPIFAMDNFVLRPVLSAGAIVRPALTVLGAAILAGAVPSWFAANVDPAKSLRGL